MCGRETGYPDDSPWWRILFFCLGATSPLRCLRACKSAYSHCALSFFSCVVDFYLFYFSSLASIFFDFDLDVVCFILSCSSEYYLCCLLGFGFGFGFCCVCVLHIKPVFLPVDIQHTQYPWRFFLLERYKQTLWSQNHDAEMLHCNAVTMQ